MSTRCHDKDGKIWDEYVSNIQIGLNTTIHKTVGKSTSELLFGFKIRSDIENILSDVIDITTDTMNEENLQEMRQEVIETVKKQ